MSSRRRVAFFRNNWTLGDQLQELDKQRENATDFISSADVYQEEVFEVLETPRDNGLRRFTFGENRVTGVVGNGDLHHPYPRNPASMRLAYSDDSTTAPVAGRDRISSIAVAPPTGQLPPAAWSQRTSLDAARKPFSSRSVGCFTMAKQFMKDTTAHGLPRVVKANSMCGRLMWSFIFCAAMIAFTVQSSLLVTNFLRYDVTNKIKVVTDESSLEFPSVTVCNTNKLRRSAIAESPYKRMLMVDDTVILPYYGPCMSGDFACSSGMFCIKQYLVCDGVRHCFGDNSDEEGCVYGECGNDQFRCASGSDRGVCIPRSSQCNRRVDCYEGEDENDCECKSSEFKCAITGGCVLKSKRCDGTYDCVDSTDEENCPDKSCEGGFSCDRGAVCIPLDFKCDNYDDCADSTDEDGCEQQPTQLPGFCTPDEFECRNGHCIQQYWVCDGSYDCSDRSDEAPSLCGGGSGGCPEEEFMCDGSVCMANYLRCNGVTDCFDGSDEEMCDCYDFLCDSGKCIANAWVCDDVEDCEAGEDENAELCESRNCEQTLDSSPNGTIASLGYPDNYQNDMSCVTTVDVSSFGEGVIRFVFHDINIEDGYQCPYDYVQFEDAVTMRLSDKYCGSSLPQPWSSDSGRVSVTFVSDGSVVFRGYNLSYSLEAGGGSQQPPSCSSCGCQQTSPSGNFTSPGYPGSPVYTQGCIIFIDVPDGRVFIDFLVFDMPSNFGDDCQDSQTAIQITDSVSMKKTGKLCGVMPISNWTSDSGKVKINMSLGLYDEYQGILAEYETIPALNGSLPCYGHRCPNENCIAEEELCNRQDDCGDNSDEEGCPVDFCGYTFTEVSGVIMSTNYPNNYPSSHTCAINIDIPRQDAQTIVVTFDSMDMPGTPGECYDPSLTIFDLGAVGMGPPPAALCGTEIPPPFTISGQAQIYFYSSESNGTGFMLHYSAVLDSDPASTLPVQTTGQTTRPTSTTPAGLTTTSQNVSQCDEDEFDCGNGTECIHSYRECDTVLDCSNERDEDSDCVGKVYARTDIFSEGWYDDYSHISSDIQLFESFRQNYYRDNRFERVKGEDPPDWAGFMTFSSTPDFSDLEQVLKLRRDEIHQYGHQLEDFVLQCTYDERPCNMSEDFVVFQDELYGNCFKFNHGKNGRSVLNATRTGSNYGLKLTLFLEQSEYISIYGRDAGARVNILPHDVPSFPFNEGLTIKPGTITSLAIKEHIATRLSHPYGECQGSKDQKQVDNTYYGSSYRYKLQACQKYCLEEKIASECGCTRYFPGEDLPPCSVLNKTQDLCQQLMQFLFQKNLLDCDCRQPCWDKYYSYTASQSAWPADVYLRPLLRSLHSTNDKTRNINDMETVSLNLASLVIYFDDLTYEIVSEHPDYPIESLFSDIGGTLGLYIGLSIITVLEFFEFIFDAMAFCLVRFNDNTHRRR